MTTDKKNEMKIKKHWVDEISERIVTSYPGKNTFTCAAGITPSGKVHIGNFRDVITSDLICKALKDRNYNAELIFFWDDYDRFRKVPENVPESFSQFIGMPLSKIPDPYDCHESFAEHFEREFEESLPELGITPRFIYQTREYERNSYYREIKIALKKRREIIKILSRFKTQEIFEEDIESYFPFRVYCRRCKKDSTKITNYNGEDKIAYFCSCGQKEILDISKENIGKLAWRVDWAMRWFHYDICFEPGGKDHASPGGSYDSSKEIAEKIFQAHPPIFQGYEFVGIRGLTSKMSSSGGIGVTPTELLKIYEPELLRWLFTRDDPKHSITFCFDSEIIRQYDEFDRELDAYFEKKLASIASRSLFFARIDTKEEFPKERVSFRQIASFGQVVQGNYQELKKMFKRIGQKFDEQNLRTRLEKSQNWIEIFIPQLKIKVRELPNVEYFNKLSKEEKEQIVKLREEMDKYSSLEELTTFVYAIPKRPGLSDSEKKKRQRTFFKNIYNMLINSDTGPRLSTFLIALGKEKIKRLLEIND